MIANQQSCRRTGSSLVVNGNILLSTVACYIHFVIDVLVVAANY